MMIGLIRTTRS